MASDEVLSAQDIKELTPLYDAVVLALKQVYDPEIPVNISSFERRNSVGGNSDKVPRIH